MLRRFVTLGPAALTLAALILHAPVSSAQPKDTIVKGKVQIGRHTVKLQGASMYQVRVEGNGFHPQIYLSKGSLLNPEQLDRGDTLQGYLFAKQTGDLRISVLPSLFGNDNAGDGLLDYTLTLKPIPLDPKPLQQQTVQLNNLDPRYRPSNGGSGGKPFKSYPIKMKARQFYVIDLEKVGTNAGVDPYLYLEDGDHKVVANNDDGGEGNDSLLIYQPRRDGEYFIITTILFDRIGPMRLTVRTEAR